MKVKYAVRYRFAASLANQSCLRVSVRARCVRLVRFSQRDTMGSGKVKFSINLSITFEGDSVLGGIVQQGVQRSLTPLIETEGRILGVEEQPETLGDSTPVTTATKRRRRTRVSAAAPDGEQRKGRPASPTSVLGLCEGLVKEQFFSVKRTAEEVREHLVNKGHNRQPNRIADALLNLTKKGILSRQKNDGGVFVYEASA